MMNSLQRSLVNLRARIASQRCLVSRLSGVTGPLPRLTPLNNMVGMSNFQCQNIRFSSSASSSVSKVDKRLSGLLREEHRYELESTPKEPEQLSSFLKRHGWSVHDQDNSMEIVLKKTVGLEDITVAFSASQVDDSEVTVEGGEEEEEARQVYEDVKTSPQNKDALSQKKPLESEEETTESEDEGLPYEMEEIDFIVMIKKQTDKHGLLFDCVAVNGAVEIESLRYFADAALMNATDAKTSHDRSNSYQGPMIAALEDKVQDAFFDYLEARGIDNDLAIFVRDYIAFKEQKEYVRWLENVQKFIDGKR